MEDRSSNGDRATASLAVGWRPPHPRRVSLAEIDMLHLKNARHGQSPGLPLEARVLVTGMQCGIRLVLGTGRNVGRPDFANAGESVHLLPRVATRLAANPRRDFTVLRIAQRGTVNLPRLTDGTGLAVVVALHRFVPYRIRQVIVRTLRNGDRTLCRMPLLLIDVLDRLSGLTIVIPSLMRRVLVARQTLSDGPSNGATRAHSPSPERVPRCSARRHAKPAILRPRTPLAPRTVDLCPFSHEALCVAAQSRRVDRRPAPGTRVARGRRQAPTLNKMSGGSAFIRGRSKCPRHRSA